MNYELLVLAFLLCGIGLTLGFVFSNSLGFVLDGVDFMLFLYVLYTRNEEETFEVAKNAYHFEKLEKQDEVGIPQNVGLYEKRTWICPNCKATNLNENTVCHNCKRIRPLRETE
jgi:hypothetical protein